jgi:hypothetical protein
VPYKSKKNRRNIPPNRVSVTSSAGTAENSKTLTGINQPEKSRPVYGNTSKTSAAAVPIQTHFLSEIKWIGLVAVIIVILLVVAYYIFR